MVRPTGLNLPLGYRWKLTFVGGLVLVSNLLAPTVASAALSQGYQASSSIVPGTIVSLDPSRPNSIVPASVDQTDGLIGVVVASDSALLSLSTAGNEVQVATSGLTTTFVSTINGDIKIGDKITPSPIEGVGMKAVLSSKVVGVAQSDFTSTSSGVTTRQIKDRSGASKTVTIGQIPLLIEVAYYVTGNGDQKTILPRFVQDLVNAIAGKKVSLLRISLAAALLLFALVTVGVLIFGSVHSSIISIGRNPLSQRAVYRSLVSVILISVVILLVTLGAVYLIISR